jgi:hypothetical protein
MLDKAPAHAASTAAARKIPRLFYMTTHRFHILAVVLAVAVLALAGCTTTPPYRYHYRPGYTATVWNGRAVAPDRAPEPVKRAVEAGNEIVGLPYRRGGGHGCTVDGAYDCSGAASHVLIRAGLLDSPTTSTAFRRYGQRGPGQWITVYARRGHVFLVIAGLRFDTGWGEHAHGPQWLTRGRPANGAVLRHPAGL